MPRGSAIPRPRRVEVVIGKPIYPPGRSPAQGSLPSGEEGLDPQAAGGATRRGPGVPAGDEELSDEIAAGIQAVFDQAQRLAGVEQVAPG